MYRCVTLPLKDNQPVKWKDNSSESECWIGNDIITLSRAGMAPKSPPKSWLS